jgi:hypothetical protein
MSTLASVAEPQAAQPGGAPLYVWVVVVVSVLSALALVLLFFVSARYVQSGRAIQKEIKNAAAEMRRFGEISQRQTELNNAPLLKVTGIEEKSPDEGRGMRITVRNVGFGSAVNVRCVVLSGEKLEQEHKVPQTELIGNETVTFDSPILRESVDAVRLEYLSQGGSYAHTTQFMLKTAAQSYALHRVR